MANLEQVRSFWESNPLWTGESQYKAGSNDFYEEHRAIYISDCFAGTFDIRFLPPPRKNGQNMKVLDLGCGVGFWVSEFAMRGIKNLYAADLTKNALDLTKKRLDSYGLKASLSEQNAENMTFSDESFNHVNCQGVIHHTPNTSAAVAEIFRVLKPGGTASISVYYRNPILKIWPFVRWLGILLTKLGGGLKGRGRESIFLEHNIDEIVRLYDGDKNPLGKSYSKKQIVTILANHFDINDVYLHFFPARSLPINIPKRLHKWLDRKLGFMIYVNVIKPCAD